jgi:hypothetical protein
MRSRRGGGRGLNGVARRRRLGHTRSVSIEEVTHDIPATMERRSVQKELLLIGRLPPRTPSTASTRRGAAKKNRKPTRTR